MKRILLVSLALFFVTLSGCVTITPSDQAARTAATDWLALLDAGKYQEAYDAQPPRIKSEVGKQHFFAWIQAHRAPLGKVKSREFFQVSYGTTMPGAPDGSYGAIFFKSSYEHKAHALERIVVTQETGHWQVMSCSIH